MLPPPPKNDKISSAFSYNFKSALTIIVGVAVSIGANLSDLLQGINNNQSGVGMVTDKLFKLFVKPCAELLCIYGEV